MNHNDIIKALECQLGLDDSCNCNGCLYREDKSCIDASERILEVVKDLINHQKAEIERLETECEKQYEQAKADILGNMADGGTSCHWCIDQHRAEAIKEFAGRIMKCIVRYTVYDEGGWDSKEEAVRIEDIASILREMTGGNK